MKYQMKKISLFLLAGFAFIHTAFSQAKKPTIMVVPSDAWCVQNGAVITFDNMGSPVQVPDYKKAMLNTDLLLVIGKINSLMADRGFPLKDLSAALKSIDQENAEASVTSSKTSRASISENPVDKLKKTAKADIIIQLTYTINKTGPKKSITYNMQGLDSYTDKQVAGAQGTGAPSFSADLPVLLEEAVLANLDNFNYQLQKHFDDMFANGREITIRIKKFDSWDKDLEDEINGDAISEIIEDYLSKNTKNGRFTTSDATENMMYIEQVRIPLYDAKGKATDARAFVRGLQKFLQAPPYAINSKLTMKGLGQATLILGEK